MVVLGLFIINVFATGQATVNFVKQSGRWHSGVCLGTQRKQQHVLSYCSEVLQIVVIM